MDPFVIHVSDRIAFWLEASKKRCQTKLANELGISEATLRRLIKKDGNPSYEVTVALLSIVDVDLAVEYVARRHPKLLEQFKWAANSSVIAKPGAADVYLKDSEHFLIFVFCLTGASIETMVKHVGEDARIIVKKLVSLGLVTIDGDKVHLKNKDFTFAGIHHAAKIIQYIVELFKDFAENERTAEAQVELVSAIGYSRFNDATRRYQTEVRGLLSDPECQGDRILMFGIMSGLIKGEKS